MRLGRAPGRGGLGSGGRITPVPPFAGPAINS